MSSGRTVISKTLRRESYWLWRSTRGFDDYWEPFTSGLGPSGSYCVSLDPEQQAALRDACFRRLGSPAAPFTLRARAWYAVGRV